VARELESRFGLSPDLKEVGNGVFDVLADGELVFSKHSEGRYPLPGEVTTLLKCRNTGKE